MYVVEGCQQTQLKQNFPHWESSSGNQVDGSPLAFSFSRTGPSVRISRAETSWLFTTRHKWQAMNRQSGFHPTDLYSMCPSILFRTVTLYICVFFESCYTSHRFIYEFWNSSFPDLKNNNFQKWYTLFSFFEKSGGPLVRFERIYIYIYMYFLTSITFHGSNS